MQCLAVGLCSCSHQLLEEDSLHTPLFDIVDVTLSIFILCSKDMYCLHCTFSCHAHVMFLWAESNLKSHLCWSQWMPFSYHDHTFQVAHLLAFRTSLSALLFSMFIAQLNAASVVRKTKHHKAFI